MLLKRLHTLTLKSFLPPFFATLFISVFLFFLVQIVITYLDDLIGKGLRTIDLITLFTYAWVTIIPQCIPLAVLLASIMSFGNLAENYELAAMKSSGLSLLRIIKPIFVFIIILGAITFLFNNFVLPVVHLKSTALLYDIRQKKPAVNIKEGIFYNGIDNYSIRVGKKSEDKETLHDIFIYDHSAHVGNNIQMYANSGKIHTSADTSELILFMRDGNRYEEIKDRNDPTGKKRSLSQLSFKQLQVNIPLEDFKLKRTNEELFKGHEEMLNVWQLDSVIDSTRRILNRRLDVLAVQTGTTFYPRTSATIDRSNSSAAAKKGKGIQPVRAFYDSLPDDKYSLALQNALNITRSVAGNLESSQMGIENERSIVVKFLMEWHKKIVVCFACIVLFFVGAPLGAIIKKGGLGLPVIVSVLFFLAYYILTEVFMHLALDHKLPPGLAMWMPNFIFLPVSVFLTIKAANDSAMFDLTAYYNWLSKFKSRSAKGITDMQ